jgi:peptidoglycan/xylan/chitin deacetylase (PgdA/CDA1 family)
VVVKYKKQISVVVIAALILFNFTDLYNKKQMKLLNSQTVKLENTSNILNTEMAELKIINKQLWDEKAELAKVKDNLAYEVESLKSEKEKLQENNDALQKQNSDLKKKLEAYESKKQLSLNNAGTVTTSADKIAYLTFDDGPSDNTPKILDILKENNINATFFVNGYPERKEIYKRMLTDGHTIGNHTYSHSYAALYQTVEGFNKDKQKLEDLIFTITGFKPQILRFPGGSNNQVSYRYGGTAFMDTLTNEVKQSGIKYFDWNIDSSDASVATQDKNKIITEVLNGAKNKKQAIILMHDSLPKTTTVLALPSIISGLKDQGFSFSVLSPEVNPIQFK